MIVAIFVQRKSSAPARARLASAPNCSLWVFPNEDSNRRTAIVALQITRSFLAQDRVGFPASLPLDLVAEARAAVLQR